MTTIALLCVAAAGCAIALYFTLVSAGRIPPDGRFIPQFCRMEGKTCMTVLGHPDARLFGVRNSLVGIVFYVLVAVSAIAGKGNTLRQVVVIGAGIAITSGIYLTYSLLVKVKIRCTLCFISHGLNLLILLLLVFDEVQL